MNIEETAADVGRTPTENARHYDSDSILSDRDILAIHAARADFIQPFISESVRRVGPDEDDLKVISYGLTSFGYDARLASDVRVFKTSLIDRLCDALGLLIRHSALDPKGIDSQAMKNLKVYSDSKGSYVILPPNAFALGHTVETFRMPSNVMATCLAKSTYARSAIALTVTPLEPGWDGVVTLEIKNMTNLPVRLYIGEGICQFVFHANRNGCMINYGDRKGKYQNQTGITMPKV